MSEAVQAVARARVTIGSESYVFDRNALTLTDLFAIKSVSGLDFNPFLQGLGDGNPLALQTLVWFLRHKAGLQGDRTSVEFKIGELDMEPITDEPDPTAASSEESVTATSDDSPTSAI